MWLTDRERARRVDGRPRRWLRRVLVLGRRRQPTSLRLWLPPDVPLVQPGIPCGYSVRGFASGDEEAWCALLNAGGELGHWSLRRLQRVIEGGLVRSSQRFVVRGDQFVACAGVYQRCCCGLPAWEVGWIATHPHHRRSGLGRCVTIHALLASQSLSLRPIFLLTDDFRLPALHMYLGLGFVPDCTTPDFARRWRLIRDRLRHPALLESIPPW